MSDARNVALVDDLRKSPAETACVEFKAGNADPVMIGKSISALANSARLYEKHCAYMVWGIADESHEIVGTQFDPETARVQQQPLQFWLAQRLGSTGLLVAG